MTRNNTLHKVHVTAMSYRSCCRRIQICLERQPHKVAVRLCALKSYWKNCWKSRWHVIQCPP